MTCVFETKSCVKTKTGKISFYCDIQNIFGKSLYLYVLKGHILIFILFECNIFIVKFNFQFHAHLLKVMGNQNNSFALNVLIQ